MSSIYDPEDEPQETAEEPDDPFENPDWLQSQAEGI